MKETQKRTVFRAALALFAACGLAITASAQTDGSALQRQTVDRQRRFDQLQQLQLDNRLRANEEVPAGQRALIDYGGYVTLQYFSIDDRNGNNHGLRQPDFVAFSAACAFHAIH